MLQLGCNKFLNSDSLLVTSESFKIPTEDLCQCDLSPTTPQVGTGVMLSLPLSVTPSPPWLRQVQELLCLYYHCHSLLKNILILNNEVHKKNVTNKRKHYSWLYQAVQPQLRIFSSMGSCLPWKYPRNPPPLL